MIVRRARLQARRATAPTRGRYSERVPQNKSRRYVLSAAFLGDGLGRDRLFTPKQFSVYFAAIVFWKRGYKFYPARILVDCDSRFNELLDLIGEFFARFASLPCDDKRLWLH